MRKLLALLLTALFVGSSVAWLDAAPPRDREMRELRKHQKEQRKTLKIKQRSMKQTMKRHEIPEVERKRFKHQLKMERQVLRMGQRNDAQSLKQRRKFSKRNHEQGSE